MPRPKFPVEETQVNCRSTVASPKRTVEEAERPFVRRSLDEVAAETPAKSDDQVKSKAPDGVA